MVNQPKRGNTEIVLKLISAPWAPASLLALLAACSSRPQMEGGPAVYPSGVLPFKDTVSAEKAGLYPGRGANCCFLGRRAALTLQPPAGSTTAILYFYVPKVAPYASGGESITVTAAGKAFTATNSTKPSHILIELPLTGQQTKLRVAIVASRSFVPRKIGVNNDSRELSVMLTNVRYR